MRTGLGSSRLGVLVVAVALCLGAAYVVVKVLGASEFGNAPADVIWVTVIVVFFGLNALAGLYLAGARPALAAFGYLTAIVTVLTLVTLAVHVLEGDLLLGGDWHLQGVGLALSLAAGQISVLLALDRADDPPALRLVTFAGVADLLAFGFLAAYSASGHAGVSISDKVFGVLATLYLLAVSLVVLVRGAIWLEGRVERRARAG